MGRLKSGVFIMLMPVDSQHITLLHWAALNDRVEVAGLLVEAGVPVDSVGGRLASTALHWAAHSGSLSVLALLVSRAARLDLPDTDGCLPIHVAAGQGSTTCLVYMVARGQHVDTPDREGRTPLMIALARSDSHDTIRQLGQQSKHGCLNVVEQLHYLCGCLLFT